MRNCCTLYHVIISFISVGIIIYHSRHQERLLTIKTHTIEGRIECKSFWLHERLVHGPLLHSKESFLCDYKTTSLTGTAHLPFVFSPNDAFELLSSFTLELIIF